MLTYAHVCGRMRTYADGMVLPNNMAQIACLLAEREGIDNIIFSGGFIRDNAYVWSKISFGLDFWSNRYCGAAYAHVCSRMLTYADVC